MTMAASMLRPWVLTLLLTGCALQPARETVPPPQRANPLLAPSGLPYGYPDFSIIRSADFAPALDAAMAEHLREIDAIVRHPAPPDFVNTVEALERSGQTLDRVFRSFSMLVAAHADDVLRQTQAVYSPRIAVHSDQIFLDAGLFARVDAVYRQRARLGLDSESLRLLEHTHRRFVRAGAGLAPEVQARIRALNARQAALMTEFVQKLQADTNDLAVVLERVEDLEGLPASAVAAASAAAEARGLKGRHVIALQLPTPQPAVSDLRSREVREQVYRAALVRGHRGNEWDTREVLRELALLRAERAALLGYPHHAAFVLEDQTAGSLEAVEARMAQLVPAARRNAEAEAEVLLRRLREDGHAGPLQPWDWPYYAEAERRERYAFDASEVKPYFEMTRVLEDGAFHLAERLYGLRFERRNDLPVYHPDVSVYEVFEGDGAPLGLFLFDPYARPSKRGGAWMNALVNQSGLLGRRAVVTNTLNVPRPPEGEPTLLTLTEATTLFHEFGHALHGLFSNVRYPSFAGTFVPRDFVEFPSQVHEMGVLDPDMLRHYARHHETGEPLPEVLVARIEAAEAFNQGFASLEYLAATMLDLAWHRLPADAAVSDVLAFEADALRAAGVDFAPVPPRYRSTYFNHIFASMYSAGYYAYIWSEVLDADAVAWFAENGGLTRENGERFRRYLLSRGGAEDAMAQYRAFAGRDPQIDPLLERRGLK